jgi:CBS domain containing-hemolysin-like protein
MFGIIAAGIILFILVVVAIVSSGNTNTSQQPNALDQEMDARAQDDKTVYGWLAQNRNRLPKKDDSERDYDFRYRYGDAAQALLAVDGVTLRAKSVNEFFYLSGTR